MAFRFLGASGTTAFSCETVNVVNVLVVASFDE